MPNLNSSFGCPRCQRPVRSDIFSGQVKLNNIRDRLASLETLCLHLMRALSKQVDHVSTLLVDTVWSVFLEAILRVASVRPGMQ